MPTGARKSIGRRREGCVVVETISMEASVDGRLTVVTRPADDGPWPGVVMLCEAFGIDDVMRRHAARLAGFGYVVAVPDLIGEGSWLRCVRATMQAFQARAGKPFELIEACRRRLLADPGCTDRVGVIGFCMGGGFALLSAGPDFAAAAVNYGPVPDDIDTLAERACPIVASYGGRDRWLIKDVPRLTAALRKHHVPHDVEVYPSAGHSFLNDAYNGPLAFRTLLRPLVMLAHAGPEPVAAADAWRRIEEFFAEHLSS
jgi:carboxymethylenebutenolidase